jgi:alanine racemase
MDMTMADVTDVSDVRLGDEAVLIGRQGAEEISADEVAEVQGTISYEILSRISPRVPRVYLPRSQSPAPPN